MSRFVLELAAVTLAFFGSAFFSGLETGVVSCDRIRLRYLSEQGNREARLLLDRLVHPDRLVALTLVGTNLCNVVASALVTSIALARWGETGAAVTVPLFIILVILFAEILPKAMFRRHADAFVLHSAYPLVVADLLLGAAARLTHQAVLLPLRLLPGGGEAAPPRLTREELAHFFERFGHAGSAGRRWFRAVFGLSERTVGSVLVPLGKLPSVDSGATVSRAAAALRASGASFLLVTNGSGAPRGTLHAHDLLDVDSGAPLEPLVRAAPSVPAERKIEDLLPQIQTGRTPIVFVTRSPGEVTGIVTHESIAFGIVGNIEESPA